MAVFMQILTNARTLEHRPSCRKIEGSTYLVNYGKFSSAIKQIIADVQCRLLKWTVEQVRVKAQAGNVAMTRARGRER
eukprot:4120240-Karenia_brevis.AAC.2